MAADEPITVERLERALDKLAAAMIRLGPKGPRALPIYERLERELEALRVVDDKMAAVRERLRRSQDRKAATSSKVPPAAI